MSPGHTLDWGELILPGESREIVVQREGIQDARGWPFLAFWCEIDYPPADPSMRYREPGSPTVHNGILVTRFKPAQWDLSDTRVLPCRPIWSGVALNSSIYAAAWFFLLGGHLALRRHLRTIRGHCPRCAYDLTTLPPTTPCPECGTAQLP